MNISKTLLRTDETMKKYAAEMKALEAKGLVNNPFKDLKQDLVKEFDNWVIIENKYPYDAIAKVSHILVSKREVPFKWDLLNEAEIKEFESLREHYLNEHYDLIWENLPKGQTIPGHFHLNLLVLKREPI